jgi:hypothetical protein
MANVDLELSGSVVDIFAMDLQSARTSSDIGNVAMVALNLEQLLRLKSKRI